MKKDFVVSKKGGVLTPEILHSAHKAAQEQFGLPSKFVVSPHVMNAFVAWEKFEKYLKTLPPLKQKLERLRHRLKNRRPHLKMNLPL